MKIAPGLILAFALLCLVGCSTAANRRSVYAPYQQPTVWDDVLSDWESHRRPNQTFPDPFNNLPPLQSEPSAEVID